MKQVRNLRDELVKLAGGHDKRFGDPWAKLVTAVDATQVGGYAFQGEFLPAGTCEIESRPQVFLVMTQAGSMKYHYKHYHVVEMDADGGLRLAGISTSDETKGWALRIRDAVAALVAETAAQAAAAPADPLAAALSRALDAVLPKLADAQEQDDLEIVKGYLPGLTEAEIRARALARLRAEIERERAQQVAATVAEEAAG